MSSDESIWRMRVLSTAMPEYVGELVRCKDCAHHDERGYMPGRVTCRMHSGIWDKDDFCSKAERRASDDSTD